MLIRSIDNISSTIDGHRHSVILCYNIDGIIIIQYNIILYGIKRYLLWRHVVRACSQVDTRIVVDAGQNEEYTWKEKNRSLVVNNLACLYIDMYNITWPFRPARHQTPQTKYYRSFVLLNYLPETNTKQTYYIAVIVQQSAGVRVDVSPDFF